MGEYKYGKYAVCVVFLYLFLRKGIELSDKCDMYKAWKMINEIRDLRKQRRNIKDEKLVLSGIKSQCITYLNRSSVHKCVDGLSKRKYRIRIVEEYEEI